VSYRTPGESPVPGVLCFRKLELKLARIKNDRILQVNYLHLCRMRCMPEQLLMKNVD